MDNNSPRFYQFGEFRLDTKRRLLFKNNEQISLTARLYDLLYVFIKSDGKVLEHDELLDQVWDGAFVEQSNLKKSVSALRHILGEQANESRYISTIPRKGYSFVADVEAVNETETIQYRETEREIIYEEIIEEESEAPPIIEVSSKSLPPKPPSFFQRYQTIILGFVILLILIPGLYFSYRYLFHKSGITYSVESIHQKRLTNEGTLGNATAISFDGNYVVYPVYEGENGSLRIRQTATGTVTTITSPAQVSYWAYTFSPDGNFVYYILNTPNNPAQSGLFKMPVLGDTPQKLQDNAGGGLSFSPDGSRLAYTRASEDRLNIEVVSVKADGSDLKKIYSIPENRFLYSLNWSPDGKTLLCSFREVIDDKGLYHVAAIPVENNSGNPTEKIILEKQANPIISAVWMPDQSSIILSIREPNADICQLWQYFPATGEKKRITNDNSSYRFASLTKDGKTLVANQQSFLAGIWVANTEDYDFKPITGNGLAFGETVWTNDNRIAYILTEHGEESIWIMNEDGSKNLKITDGKDGIFLTTAASTDRSAITFSSSRTSGLDQIWGVGFDGKNLNQLAINPQRAMSQSKLLADGKTLLYSGYGKPQGWLLYKQTPDGKTVNLTETHTEDWQISGDEKLLFCRIIDESSKKSISQIRDFATNQIIKTVEINSGFIRWSPDNKGLVYLKSNKDLYEIIYQSIDGNVTKKLYSSRGERIFGFEYSQDGKKIVIVRGRFNTDAILINAGNPENK